MSNEEKRGRIIAGFFALIAELADQGRTADITKIVLAGLAYLGDDGLIHGPVTPSLLMRFEEETQQMIEQRTGKQ